MFPSLIRYGKTIEYILPPIHILFLVAPIKIKSYNKKLNTIGRCIIFITFLYKTILCSYLTDLICIVKSVVIKLYVNIDFALSDNVIKKNQQSIYVDAVITKIEMLLTYIAIVNQLIIQRG
jgi:hypothetical protein